MMYDSCCIVVLFTTLVAAAPFQSEYVGSPKSLDLGASLPAKEADKMNEINPFDWKTKEHNEIIKDYNAELPYEEPESNFVEKHSKDYIPNLEFPSEKSDTYAGRQIEGPRSEEYNLPQSMEDGTGDVNTNNNFLDSDYLESESKSDSFEDESHDSDESRESNAEDSPGKDSWIDDDSFFNSDKSRESNAEDGPGKDSWIDDDSVSNNDKSRESYAGDSPGEDSWIDHDSFSNNDKSRESNARESPGEDSWIDDDSVSNNDKSRESNAEDSPDEDSWIDDDSASNSNEVDADSTIDTMNNKHSQMESEISDSQDIPVKHPEYDGDVNDNDEGKEEFGHVANSQNRDIWENPQKFKVIENTESNSDETTMFNFDKNYSDDDDNFDTFEDIELLNSMDDSEKTFSNDGMHEAYNLYGVHDEDGDLTKTSSKTKTSDSDVANTGKIFGSQNEDDYYTNTNVNNGGSDSQDIVGGHSKNDNHADDKNDYDADDDDFVEDENDYDADDDDNYEADDKEKSVDILESINKNEPESNKGDVGDKVYDIPRPAPSTEIDNKEPFQKHVRKYDFMKVKNGRRNTDIFDRMRYGHKVHQGSRHKMNRPRNGKAHGGQRRIKHHGHHAFIRLERRLD